MVLRILAVVGALAAAPSAFGQASAGSAPPAQQPPPSAPPQQAPAQGPATAQQPQAPPAATGGTAAGPAAPPPAAPPATAQSVSPPPAQSAPPAQQGGTGSAPQQTPVVVEQQRVTRPPLETVAVNAGYGALVGLLVGGGVALIEQDHVGRDLMVGTGIGVIVGAVVGAVQVGTGGGDRPARDGLGSMERNQPPRGTVTVGLYGGRF